MSSSGVQLRPRYGRIAAFAVAASTTLVSLTGTVLTRPAGGDSAPSDDRSAMSLAAAASAASTTAASTGLRASLSVGLPPPGSGPPAPEADRGVPSPYSGGALLPPDSDDALPRDSGEGRRVVFDESAQRVWLVRGRGEVARTYLVSGSVYDNLDPGTYEVYSRSAIATGIDGSALRWMVRFTTGANAAIGFHWIPRVDGEPVQTRAELGTPLSHGCIRQATPDAKALWRFAPVGTTVVVTA